MQVEVKLIFSSPAEAAAFLAADPVDIRFAVTKPAASPAVSAAEKAAALQANETAMADTVEAPGKSSPAKTARTPRTAEEAPAAAPAPTAPAQESSAAASAEAQPQASTAATEAPFEYATLQKAVNARVAKFGKDALLAVAKKHGAATFKDLPASAWAAAHADVIALGE